MAAHRQEFEWSSFAAWRQRGRARWPGRRGFAQLRTSHSKDWRLEWRRHDAPQPPHRQTGSARRPGLGWCLHSRPGHSQPGHSHPGRSSGQRSARRGGGRRRIWWTWSSGIGLGILREFCRPHSRPASGRQSMGRRRHGHWTPASTATTTSDRLGQWRGAGPRWRSIGRAVRRLGLGSSHRTERSRRRAVGSFGPSRTRTGWRRTDVRRRAGFDRSNSFCKQLGSRFGSFQHGHVAGWRRWLAGRRWRWCSNGAREHFALCCSHSEKQRELAGG